MCPCHSVRPLSLSKKCGQILHIKTKDLTHTYTPCLFQTGPAGSVRGPTMTPPTHPPLIPCISQIPLQVRHTFEWIVASTLTQSPNIHLAFVETWICFSCCIRFYVTLLLTRTTHPKHILPGISHHIYNCPRSTQTSTQYKYTQKNFVHTHAHTHTHTHTHTISPSAHLFSLVSV